MNELKSQHNLNAFLIDGDLVRSKDLGKHMLAANVLEQTGTIPIVCNISPFKTYEICVELNLIIM